MHKQMSALTGPRTGLCALHTAHTEIVGAERLRHACAQLPKLLELVGLGYTAWFVYRYLLFKVRWLLVNGLPLVRMLSAVPASCLRGRGARPGWLRHM